VPSVCLFWTCNYQLDFNAMMILWIWLMFMLAFFLVVLLLVYWFLMRASFLLAHVRVSTYLLYTLFGIDDCLSLVRSGRCFGSGQ